MLIKENKYKIIVENVSYGFYDIKVWFSKDISLYDVSRDIETYGLQFENATQEFIDYLIMFVGFKTKVLHLYSEDTSLEYKIWDDGKKLIFADEGKENLKMFIK